MCTETIVVLFYRDLSGMDDEVHLCFRLLGSPSSSHEIYDGVSLMANLWEGWLSERGRTEEGAL